MKTIEEFVKEYYQLPQSKIETVRIKSLIKCVERYKEYQDSEVKKLNIPAVIKSVCECDEPIQQMTNLGMYCLRCENPIKQTVL